MEDRFNCMYTDDENATTEATEKMFTAEGGGKFEIVLDIVKVNTSVTIGD